MPSRSLRSSRRADIAAAGVRLIAGNGVRALTHRAIDTELGLPAGSTSYYARTRKDLVALIVQHLAALTASDTVNVPLPESIDIPTAASLMAGGLDAMSTRSADHLARYALLIEYRDDAEMRAALGGDPPLRPRLVALAAALLERIGADNPAALAPDLVTLMDGLLMQRVVKEESPNVEAIVAAYLSGLPRVARPNA